MTTSQMWRLRVTDRKESASDHLDPWSGVRLGIQALHSPLCWLMSEAEDSRGPKCTRAPLTQKQLMLSPERNPKTAGVAGLGPGGLGKD